MALVERLKAFSRFDAALEPARLPPLPETLQQHVVWEGEGKKIQVDGRYAGGSAFLTWIADLRRHGLDPVVESVAPQELVQALESTTDGQAGDAYLEFLEMSRKRHVEASELGASDLHVLQREDHAEFQLRIDGELWTVPEWELDPTQGKAFVRATCVSLATVKEATFNPMAFQEAQISGSKLPETDTESVRITRGPAYPTEAGGGVMVSRLQPRRHAVKQHHRRGTPASRLRLERPVAPKGVVDFHAMGFTPLQVALFEQIVLMPDGLFVQTGPTGSGKTTTGYELLRYKAQISPELRQITREHPVEYPREWAVQLLSTGQNSSYLVERMLRMDPDIIDIGEIRTADEGVAAAQAAQTGHLVFGSVHVLDPFELIGRLHMLDHTRLSKELMCNHTIIAAFMGQRMVPVLCTQCREPLEQHLSSVSAMLVERIKTWGDLDHVHVRGKGCPHCAGRRILGREAVAEVVLSTEELMEDFLRGTSIARRNHRLREGSDKSMLGNVMERVLAGTIDPRDAQKNIRIEAYREGV
ncbi:Flp pilus assembly complex ATPase component TadA [Ralstonia solanacearum]|uniref:ATPase, T2SS/T4P/T4SS family n=1 Tax=Ralstonia solanacearum TaxID=305 RepID=UPI0005C60133|nr:ATPase, T2SS/T4P/T4SS family [Ralstonia solanacearum]MBB6592749.1 Flp pilus assembly complex ATPase component TadA [Ralstonia solanacearum]MBB6596971.1 Flp pilus assembly complex ATPase component TadA [Ralstonia solanacearum]MDB0541215.1 Flp pilus assembly complex ATPase component TadA [Ralstonia solanacearum]MDB0551411.1 Flp pilus assembly complex ATPase component TadA [Ralstonia solanacearum]MDB0556164.1 Flp pilus assembly complex ATPase component TadA [Ralstonia solanacearum]